MSSDNWNDIYQNGYGREIDWDCCTIEDGIGVAMINARKVAIDIGKEVYLSKHQNLMQGRCYRVTSLCPDNPFNHVIARVYPGGRIEYRKDIDAVPDPET